LRATSRIRSMFRYDFAGGASPTGKASSA
jgi:hypothetical protein